VRAQVGDRLAEAGVGLDATLVDLGREPCLQVVHARSAVRLVKPGCQRVRLACFQFAG
jgi:hypothetical protein